MNEIERIDANYIALHTDVYCYICKRLVALSYCIKYDGRYYCPRCCPITRKETNEKG